ncbi:MAG: NADPH:quinone reductase, partial [Vicinamibacterales bacterium]
MKAILVREFGGPEVLTIGETADPVPGPGEVLIRVHAAGVNPYETYMRTGTYAVKPALPYIPGSDAAGVVEAVGAGVTDLAAGTRVYCYGTRDGLIGTYAEKVVCPRQRVFPLADRVSFAQGASLGVPYTTAYRALFQRGGAKPGETVLIHGATGGVGIAAVQLAHHFGMRVIGTGGTARSLEIVRQQGADVAVSHREQGYRDEIMRATGGQGVHLVIEMAAHINLNHDLTMLATGGRIVVVGNRGPVEVDARHAMNREAAILGMVVFKAPEADIASAQAAIGAGLRNGTLTPMVRAEMPLAQAAQAHEAIMGSSDHLVGKIALIP